MTEKKRNPFFGSFKGKNEANSDDASMDNHRARDAKTDTSVTSPPDASAPAEPKVAETRLQGQSSSAPDPEQTAPVTPAVTDQKTQPVSKSSAVGFSSLPFMDLYMRIDQPETARFNPKKNAGMGKGNMTVPDVLASSMEGLRQELMKIESEDSALIYEGVRLRISKKRLADGTVWASMRKVESDAPLLDKLNINPRLVQYMKSIGTRSGLLLIVGATGNGKSTTAAGLINYYMHEFGGVTYTLEDPVEYHMQGPVGDSAYCFQIHVEDEREWAEGLKTALRWHPRYIFVGEIRTPDAAGQLLRAATSGHMVITTVHGGSVEEGLAGLIQIASDAVGDRAVHLLADGLIGVMHQVLTEKGPDIKFVFTEDGNAGDPVRNLVRENQLKQLGTYIQQQSVRILGRDI